MDSEKNILKRLIQDEIIAEREAPNYFVPHFYRIVEPTEEHPYIGKRILCIEECFEPIPFLSPLKSGEYYLLSAVSYQLYKGETTISDYIIINDDRDFHLLPDNFNQYFRLITKEELRKEKIKTILDID